METLRSGRELAKGGWRFYESLSTVVTNVDKDEKFPSYISMPSSDFKYKLRYPLLEGVCIPHPAPAISLVKLAKPLSIQCILKFIQMGNFFALHLN